MYSTVHFDRHPWGHYNRSVLPRVPIGAGIVVTPIGFVPGKRTYRRNLALIFSWERETHAE